MKTYADCRIIKPLAEFHKRALNRKDGLSSYCRACTKQRNRSYIIRKKTQDITAFRLHNQERQNRYLYGLSSVNKQSIFTAQNGQCAICKETKKLHTDHDHYTNKVRGLLCQTCNCALGLFKDSPISLKTALHYLEYNLSMSARQLEFDFTRSL